ncbi:MAG: hypothetical protein M1817_002127 [Caeruleum heppii]|nr:MAG: hypothetical protein M1817_002127 [Caeruleum heppii]
MAPPSPLAIATSSVLRLVKEEQSYHKELQQQEAHLQQLQANPDSGDENVEFQMKQERRAIDETKAVLPQLRHRIADALAKLENQLEAQKEANGDTNVDEITKAKEAVADAKKAQREIA